MQPYRTTITWRGLFTGPESVALRINQKGLDYLEAHLEESSKAAVDELIFRDGELVDVAYQENAGQFKIYTAGGYCQTSTITDIEVVSYVSSPYIPASLAIHDPENPVETVDNSGRCAELDNFASDIKDELNENILLDDVYLIVCEWVPMGGNQIVALNDKLGSSERVQGGRAVTVLFSTHPECLLMVYQ